jgi:hypothetical protein
LGNVGNYRVAGGWKGCRKGGVITSRQVGGFYLAALFVLLICSLLRLPPTTQTANAEENQPKANQPRSNAVNSLFSDPQIASEPLQSYGDNDNKEGNGLLESIAKKFSVGWDACWAWVKWFWVRFWDDPINLFTLLLVAVGGLVGWQQISWMKKTIDSMEDTAQRQMRAYITIRENDIFSKPLEVFAGESFQAHVRFKNTGKTPAYDVRTSGVLCVIEGELKKDFVFPVPEIPEGASTMTMGVFQKCSFVVKATENFGYPLIEDIKLEKSKRLFLFGKIVYKDAFNKDRETFYCDLVKSIRLRQDNGLWRDGWQTIPYTYGNEAT